MRRITTALALCLLAAGCSSAPEVPVDQAEDYLAEGYADTSWYGDITDVREQSGVVWVETDLVADSDAGPSAEAICAAVSSWQLAELDEFVGVTVRAADGARLVMRTDVGGSCTAEV